MTSAPESRLTDEQAEQIRQWALDLGFDRVGFAGLRESEHRAALESWLARGDHAGMTWLERRVEERLDPRKLRPQAVSAICVALRYHPLAEEEPRGDLWPGVARYARGEDYHRVMERRLVELEAVLEQHYPGVFTWRYVDTGPVLERELAARAGLGWVGKHTNLLSRGGSWFLLGELLVGLTLPEDERLSDLCGSCTRCLDACPTGALPEPYRLDSRRCISYWTIEHRGALSEEMRSEIGEWVFGCDLCQEACPFNQRPAAADCDELELPTERRELDLVSLLLLERTEYVELFRHSPMKRPKLEGLQRNAAAVMGNRRDVSYTEALDDALCRSPFPVVRGQAAWSLGRIGESAARRCLEQARAREEDVQVLAEIDRALEASDG